MKKYVISIILVLALVGCVSTSLTPEAKQTLANNKGYKVRNVTVKFKKISFLDFSEEQKLYPNEKTLAKYFTQNINKYLKEMGNSCKNSQECLTLDMNINYTRSFNFKSVTVSAPIIDLKYFIKKDNKVIYTASLSGKPTKGSIIDRGLNELGVFTNIGNDKPNLKEERQHIDMISKVIVEEIVALGE